MSWDQAVDLLVLVMSVLWFAVIVRAHRSLSKQLALQQVQLRMAGRMLVEIAELGAELQAQHRELKARVELLEAHAQGRLQWSDDRPVN